MYPQKDKVIVSYCILVVLLHRYTEIPKSNKSKC